jgi:hypothetical protein
VTASHSESRMHEALEMISRVQDHGQNAIPPGTGFGLAEGPRQPGFYIPAHKAQVIQHPHREADKTKTSSHD